MKTEFNLTKLAETAKSRWFKTPEISHLLKNINESNLKPLLVDKLPERPFNGSFFLVDGNKTNKKWKQDGYSYIKRNNGIGFREDVVYLKLAGVKEAMCSYSYIDDSLTDNAILPNCRRIYKLVQPIDKQNSYFLVHYLNEKISNESSAEKTPENCSTETPFSTVSTSDEVSKFEMKNFEEETVTPSPVIDKAAEGDLLEAFSNIEEKPLDFISYFDSTNRTEIMFNESENRDFTDNCPSFITHSKPQFSNHPVQEENINFNAIDYSLIQNRFSEIESRLKTLEVDKPFPLFQPIGSLPYYEKEDGFNIVDYSPEWDYTKGGSKVIICVNPLCIITDMMNERVKVKFGETSVAGYFIQPGVIKCYAPTHTEGFVRLTIWVDGELVTSQHTKSLFEFRKQRKYRHENRSKISIKNADAENMGSEFKVRIVDKMNQYNSQFGPIDQSGRTFENSGIFKQYLETNFEEVHDMESFLPQADCLQILQFMNNNKTAEMKEDFQRFLDAVDNDGYNLLHYMCYLQYSDCVDYLLKSSAKATVAMKNGMTALEIALKLKNEKMLDILIANGALDPKKIDEILRKAHGGGLAQNNLDIASLFKDRNLLDMILREVSLCESINNSLSVAFPESDDHSDESYLSLFELLDDKLGDFEEGDYPGEGARSSCSSKDSPDRRFEKIRAAKRPRRYFRNYDKKSILQKENIVVNNQKANIDPVIVTDHQNQVQLIQKNVRGWLLRRQYLDILHATRVLQSYIRGKISKKKSDDEDQEDWDKMIEDKLKNKVKDWLGVGGTAV